MSRRGWNKWSDEKIALLYDLRDVQRLKWREVAERLGVPLGTCTARYQYYESKWRIAELRARVRAQATDRAHRPPVSEVGASADAEPEKRPRYFHDADAFITSRIARQGITAGILGDPPPGRSALDRRLK